MDKRYTFNEDERNYDRWRPGYCPELFAELIDYARLNAEMRAVEVGIGTGQATESILKTGCTVTAIELGERLAAYVSHKFGGYPNFEVLNLSFEDYAAGTGSIDLIYAASAFHWIPEEVAYPKAYRLLKDGGTLALFWNTPFVNREDDPLHRQIQALYSRYRPSGGKLPVEQDEKRYQSISDTIIKYGFTALRFKLFHQIRTFTSAEYIQLLNTYSDHRTMPQPQKQQFEQEIASAIEAHGNCLKVYDTIDLYLARKPSGNA